MCSYKKPNRKFVMSVESIESRLLLSTFYVKSYGAIGNGIANDAVAIQAAITAAVLDHGTSLLASGYLGSEGRCLWVERDNWCEGVTSGVRPLSGWSSPYGGRIRKGRRGEQYHDSVSSFSGDQADGRGLHDLRFSNVTNLYRERRVFEHGGCEWNLCHRHVVTITIAHVGARGYRGRDSCSPATPRFKTLR